MTGSPNIRQAVPFFLVKNMELSLRFYVDKLGFSVTREWTPAGKTEWCWLERDAVSLMLQEPRNQASFEKGVPTGKGVSICFQCLDALALYHEFTAKGVEVEEPFVGNNRWVVAFPDSDGYRLDFESPTDEPEETKYSERAK